MRHRSDPQESRFAALFDAFAAASIPAEPAVYHDEFAPEVRDQLLACDAVLVWHNPIEGGRPRAVLDAMLRDVASHGVFVSAHPDTILRMGTKDVLLAVRDLPFGSDAWRVDSLAQLRDEVHERVSRGARVLKQHRGQSGIGVWRVESLGGGRYELRHAQRGALPEVIDWDGVSQRLAPYLEQGGHMVDQAWQPRLPEGMVRAYLVQGRVTGFGHQAVVALYPAAAGEPSRPPGPRLYSGPEDARFQRLRWQLEDEWVPQLCPATGVLPGDLPLLWDADFLLGPRVGNCDSYVLCEINVSSVSPFPDSAVGPLVEATRRVA
jgi:hypothetical protein